MWTLEGWIVISLVLFCQLCACPKTKFGPLLRRQLFDKNHCVFSDSTRRLQWASSRSWVPNVWHAISWIKAYCTIQHQTLICCQIINILLCIGWYHRIYCKYSSSPGQRGKTITTKTLKQFLCFQNSQLSLKVYYSLLNFYIVNIMVNMIFMWYSLKRCLLAASVMLFPLCNKDLR